MLVELYNINPDGMRRGSVAFNVEDIAYAYYKEISNTHYPKGKQDICVVRMKDGAVYWTGDTTFIEGLVQRSTTKPKFIEIYNDKETKIIPLGRIHEIGIDYPQNWDPNGSADERELPGHVVLDTGEKFKICDADTYRKLEAVLMNLRILADV